MQEIELYLPEELSEEDEKVIDSILELINQLSPDGWEAFISVVDQIDAYEAPSEEQFE